MANQQKIDIVNQAVDGFKNSQGIYFTRYTGMSVPQITELRKAFSNNSVNYKVIKNTLTKIAAKEAGYEGKFDELLENQVAIAFSEDPVAPARVIKDFLKENEDSIEVIGVFFDGELYDAGKYKQLANLPSKEVLLGKFVSCLNSPMYGLASTLNGSMSKLVFALRAIQK